MDQMEYPAELDEASRGLELTPDCLVCITFIDWLREAWPAEDRAAMPDFQPRAATGRVRIHNQQADPMPFCDWCSQAYLAAMGEFFKEMQQRQGKNPRPMAVREEKRVATPVKPTLILPGQPGWRAP